MNRFGLISEIIVDAPETWENRVFLTFDIDWVNDIVLQDTINILSNCNARATFFATHDTKLNSKISISENFELGIHPNFNLLLNGDFTKGDNVVEVIDNTLTYAPSSCSVRSHSVTQNGHILDAFAHKGISHDSNDYIPEYSMVLLRPWTIANGLIKVPYCWADEHAFTGLHKNSFLNILKKGGLTVFDFHPIHVFLNTESKKHYNSSRQFFEHPDVLFAKRYSGFGVRSMLDDLIETTNKYFLD